MTKLIRADNHRFGLELLHVIVIKPGLGLTWLRTESWVLWVNPGQFKKIKKIFKILIFYIKKLKKNNVNIDYTCCK